MAEPERTWLRHATSGQRGYLVQRHDGRAFVRSDRPNDPTEYPYTPQTWQEEQDFKPLLIAQAAQICFEADRVLCRLIGLHDKARKEWSMLSDKERILWMRSGPSEPPVRADLWEANMGVLREHASE